MMRCAVVAPTPGNVSNVALSAVFTFMAPVAVLEDLGDWLDDADFEDFAVDVEPNVTFPCNTWAFDLPRPLTFSRSVMLL